MMEKMQSCQRFQGTPYLMDEILAARAELKRRLDQYSSRALLSLQRKCYFAVHGPQNRNQRTSFTNECFTTIQLQSSYPDIPESQLSLTRDSSDSAQSRESPAHPDDLALPGESQSEVVIDLTQQSDESSSLSSPQSNSGPTISGSNKRKFEDDHEPVHNSIKETAESLKPPRKRLHQASTSQEVVDIRSDLLTRWKCDLCRIMTSKKPLMNSHLASKGHYSASLVRCERVTQGLMPVLVIAPAAMIHTPSFGESQSEVVIDHTQQPDESSSLSSLQSNSGPPISGSDKRKFEDDHEPVHNSIKETAESLKPPRKRLHQASTSQEVVDIRSDLLTRWKCDLCRIMTSKKPLMNRHLASKGHYSASLVRCERVTQGLMPVLVIAPAAMIHTPSFDSVVDNCLCVSCCEY
ncbi:uncharacterized protein LOC135468257 isoform X2 [Liolophura sinensis]|uniref:uncharacterized protein LOC135468257 isoform X2 n=1 Tax=Liolophura sinensis TaxID=3198878 RepID=UPI003158BF14